MGCLWLDTAAGGDPVRLLPGDTTGYSRVYIEAAQTVLVRARAAHEPRSALRGGDAGRWFPKDAVAAEACDPQYGNGRHRTRRNGHGTRRAGHHRRTGAEPTCRTTCRNGGTVAGLWVRARAERGRGGCRTGVCAAIHRVVPSPQGAEPSTTQNDTYRGLAGPTVDNGEGRWTY